MINAFEFGGYDFKETAKAGDSPMDLDPKSKNKEEDKQANYRKLKQMKVQDLDDNQPEDLEMRKEVDEDLHPSHPLSSKMANLEGRGRKDRGAESTKRMRITESADPSSESVKLIEEIVKMYGEHVNHLIREVENGVKDDLVWSFDLRKYGSIDETFAEKVRRLGSELERMKHDENQYRDYIFIEPRINQIMIFMLTVHQIFDPCSKSCKKEKQICFKMCSLVRYRKEVNGIRSKVEMLKDLIVYRKEEEEIRSYFKM